MTDMTPGKMLGLRRLADATGRFKMLAVDQRPPIEDLVKKARGTQTAAFDDVAAFKRALITELGSSSSALLLDPQYIFPTAASDLPHGKGLLLTLEDDRFEETSRGRLSASIPDWSVAKIQASGGDAVKVLAWYRPDAAKSVIEHQKEFVASIGAECERLDIPFVFELLVYTFPGEAGHTTDYVEQPGKLTEHVIESVETFAGSAYGVDLFKLESPVAPSAFDDSASNDDLHQSAFDALSAAAGRPWVLLSAGANQRSFRLALKHAYQAGANGYLAGRAIWWDACITHFPNLDEMRSELASTAVDYMSDLNELTDRLATPWQDHPTFGPSGPSLPSAGSDFRASYMADSR